MAIRYCGIPQQIIDRYRDEIEKWVNDPAAMPVYGLKLQFGNEADLVKRDHGDFIEVSPERDVDETRLAESIAMAPTAKLKIELSECSMGRVWLDGVELNGVSAITYHARAGQLAELTLTIIADIDAETEVRLDKLMVEKQQLVHPQLETGVGVVIPPSPAGKDAVETVLSRLIKF
jgi:hypothetical protein